MNRDLPAALTLLVCLPLVAASDFAYINGRESVIVFAAALLAALLYSVAKGLDMAEVGEDTVEAHGPAGTSIKATGRSTVLVVLAGILLGAFVYMNIQHQTQTDTQTARIEAQLTRVFEAMAENTYILSLTQAEREALRISMPESLRRKIRSREQ